MRIKKFLAFVVLSFSAFATLYPSSSASALWGGVEVQNYNTYPDPNAKYVLYVRMNRSYCTGTVLSRHFALTAAHCKSPQYVFLGNDKNLRQGFRVVDSKAVAKSDVQVLLIDPNKPFSFSEYPQLPDKEVERNSIGYVYGWGRETKRFLKGGNVKLLGFYDRHGIKNAMIGINQNDPMTCPGDSGGPIYQNGKIVALSSSGAGNYCGKWSGLSSIYKTLPGIKQIMQEFNAKLRAKAEALARKIIKGERVDRTLTEEEWQSVLDLVGKIIEKDEERKKIISELEEEIKTLPQSSTGGSLTRIYQRQIDKLRSKMGTLD